jgi:uncharacterized membrane protein YGL010W
MTPRLRQYFADYARERPIHGHLLPHDLGTALILIGLLGGLSQWVFGPDGLTHLSYLRVDGGTLLCAVASLGYVLLDWRIGIPIAPVLYAAYCLGRMGTSNGAGVMLIAGGISRTIDRAIYGKSSPKFFKNFIHSVCIGPLWTFARWIRYDQDC